MSSPYAPNTSFCATDNVVLYATPGFGGQTCRWYASITDSIPILTDTLLVTMSSVDVTYYVTTYDTTRDAESYPRMPVHVTILPVSNTMAAMTIAPEQLPYTFMDTVFPIGTPAHSITTFTYTAANGCDSIFILDLTVTYPNDIEEQAASQAPQVYPNPVTNICHVRYAAQESAEVRVYDLAGKLLTSKPISDEETAIDFSGFTSGIYFLRVLESGRTVSTEKVVKR
jgi:hypothetical protein